MGACLLALAPLVLPVSLSCLLLSSQMKTDCNYPCLLSRNALFPGKRSWVGKGEHSMLPCGSGDH